MKETISSIQEQYRRLDKTDESLLRSFAESLMADERAAVKQIAGRALRDAEKLSQERERLEKMRIFERACEKEGFTYICGILTCGMVTASFRRICGMTLSLPIASHIAS